MKTNRCRQSGGPMAFTLLELLAVLAIIGILAALLFPSLAAARHAANRAKTRAQFAQWAMAVEAFRSTYGHYPAFHPSHLVNPPGQNSDPSTLHLFHDLLAARRRDGSPLPALTASTDPLFPEAQNRRRLRFYTFGQGELTSVSVTAPFLLCDATGSTEIAVLVDANLDGVINAADLAGPLPAVGGFAPTMADFPAAGIRAGVAFYALAPEATVTQPSFVFSWK